ncbi:MAG TPA: hypothetical protein VFV67_32555 [Actinophytocola sp.]|uniref:hypothetical protein n=1 Tax=Actinophytocola sp. TaxID=1872138 RepID=UPI002DBF5A63|nr:hypothetical protein [Actinophytocola sp.]HEU5475400.1 hypothetical protein [Actinophytocola sp.]
MTQVPAPESGEPAPRRGVPLTAVVLLVALVPFAVHAVAVLRGFFWQDDFIITYRAAQAGPLDLDYLFQAYNGEHLAPGMFLLAWLVTALAPLSFTAAMLPVLAMQAASCWLFWRLLVDCFGRRWALVPAFAVFTCSPLILLPTLWWAYAVQLIPLLLTMIGALGAHVRYLRDGRRRHAVYALLWTLAGLAFYEKAVLFPALLLAVTVLLTPGGTGLGTALRRYPPVWLAHAALLAGYAGLYVSSTTTAGSAGAQRAGFGDLARGMFVDTFLPGLFGGPLVGSGGGVSWAPPPVGVRIAVLVVAAAIVVAGLVRGRGRAGMAWLMLAAYLAVDLVLLAVTRLSLVGLIVGTDPRYVADAVPVAALFGTFAFLTPREIGAPDPEPEPALTAQRIRRPAALAVAGLTIAFMISATVSHLRLAAVAPTGAARDYVATARAELAGNPDMVIYDGPVPNRVLLDLFVADARPSRVLGLLPGPPRFDQPAETMHLLDENGRPHPIKRVENGAPGIPGTQKDCGHLVSEAPTAVRLTGAVFGRFVARLEYYTADSGEGWVSVADMVVRVEFERGVHVLHVPVEGLFDTVTLRRAIGVAPVCVVKLEVGVPRA